MADRFPLIVNSISKKIEELVSGDNLDLTGNGISVNGSTGSSGQYLKTDGSAVLWDDPKDTITRVSAEGGTLVTGNVVLKAGAFTSITQSGQDITITTTSELLEDYEEGTWTPTLSVGTLTASNGTYTRVGRLVTIYFQISGFSNTSSTNAVTINGIPFTSTTSTAVGSIFGRYINNGTGGAFTTLYINSNGLTIYNISTGAYDFLSYNEINNGASCEIYGVASYQVT